MKYTLIAFKPAQSHPDEYDREVYPADLIREDDLTEQDVIERISQLYRNPKYVKESSWLYSDCAYSDFNIFEFHEDNNQDSVNEMIRQGIELAVKFNEDGERKQQEKWKKEKELKNQKELKEKKAEYEKLKLIFESENKND